MSGLSYSAATAVEQAAAYIAALEAALGDRDPMHVLAEMPASLRRATAGLSAQQAATPERPGKWSIAQVVQHLADSDLIGGFRYRMVLAHDRPALPGYDQDRWATRLHYDDADLETALREFAVLREANLRVLERATAEDLQRVMVHAERGDESLSKMIRTYAGHDVVHLRQIARIRQAIGATSAV
ncbi:MAG: DinB family protein [Longimicrobiales bacterium]